MEEKERYELTDTDCILDTERNIVVSDVCDVVANADIITDLLNQQDKRIKELGEELENYKLCRCVDCSSEYEKGLETSIDELEQEKQQLKQQLHDLPNKIVEEVKDVLLDFSNGWWRYFMTDGCEYMLSSDLQGCLDEIIDTILKKFGDKNESNND